MFLAAPVWSRISVLLNWEARKERVHALETHSSYQILLHFLAMVFICCMLLELFPESSNFCFQNNFHQCHWRAGLQSYPCCQAGS